MERNDDHLKELQKIIRRVEIRSKRMASEQFSGEYHSSFKGKGIEFSNVREYQYGDDVRSIDWNTSARKYELYVKLFTEERERTLLLVVDGSGSMLFGSQERRKKELALEVSAVLAFSAIQNNDKVGLLIFTDQVETLLLPEKAGIMFWSFLKSSSALSRKAAKPISTRHSPLSGILFEGNRLFFL